MSGPIEPARPLSGRLAAVPAVQRAPREGRREREHEDPRGDAARDDDDGEGHGPDADGHVDLHA